MRTALMGVACAAVSAAAITQEGARVATLKMLLEDEVKDMSALDMGLHFQRAGATTMLEYTSTSASFAIVDDKDMVNADSGYLPVVQAHGMGDFANNPLGMVPLRKDISKHLNGTYVVNVPLAKGDEADMLASFFMLLDAEVEAFRKYVQNDPHLKDGFNAVGWSQGNLWLRGYVEKYNDPPIKNWISVNGPMVGVVGFPRCNYGATICKLLDSLAGDAVYGPELQDHLAQANYFRDPHRIPAYKKHCKYMPDMNNEKETTHPEYNANLMKTDNIVAVKALNDTMVWPKESEHFGFFADGSSTDLLLMKQTTWYQQDLFGLKTFDQAGRLHLVDAPGNHMQIPEKQLMALIDQYFR